MCTVVVFTYPLPGTTTTLHVILNMSYVLNEILVNTSSDLQKLELSRINCYVLYGMRKFVTLLIVHPLG